MVDNGMYFLGYKRQFLHWAGWPGHSLLSPKPQGTLQCERTVQHPQKYLSSTCGAASQCLLPSITHMSSISVCFDAVTFFSFWSFQTLSKEDFHKTMAYHLPHDHKTLPIVWCILISEHSLWKNVCLRNDEIGCFFILFFFFLFPCIFSYTYPYFSSLFRDPNMNWTFL